MKKMNTKAILSASTLLALIATFYFVFSHPEEDVKTIHVENPIFLSRKSETIVLSAELLTKLFPKEDMSKTRNKKFSTPCLITFN